MDLLFVPDDSSTGARECSEDAGGDIARSSKHAGTAGPEHAIGGQTSSWIARRFHGLPSTRRRRIDKGCIRLGRPERGFVGGAQTATPRHRHQRWGSPSRAGALHDSESHAHFRCGREPGVGHAQSSSSELTRAANDCRPATDARSAPVFRTRDGSVCAVPGFVEKHGGVSHRRAVGRKRVIGFTGRLTTLPVLRTAASKDSVRRSWQATVTITLPRFSGRAATRAAAATLAPVLMPPRMPSSPARRRAQAKASSLVTVSTPLKQAGVEILRDEAGADALDLVRARLAAGDHRRIGRLDGDRLERRVLGRMYRVTPVIVPPVPTPATIMSTRPPVSSQISGPVVCSWTAGLAGLSNCCGIQPLGVASASSWALADAPFMPSLAGVSTRFAPRARSIPRRSTLIDSGMVSVRW